MLHPCLMSKSMLHPCLMSKSMLHPCLMSKSMLHPCLMSKSMLHPCLMSKSMLHPCLISKSMLHPCLMSKSMLHPCLIFLIPPYYRIVTAFYNLLFLINPLTVIGTKFSKPHYYFGIGPFLNPINYFDYKKVKLFLVKKF